MKLRNWFTSSEEKQVKESVEVGGIELDADEEVLQTGYTLSEIRGGIEKREETSKDLKREINRHEKKKKRAIDKAKKADSETDKKDNLTTAKVQKELKKKKEKIVDHLQEEKLKLRKLQVQHMMGRLTSDTHVDVDISDLPVSDIETAIEDIGDDTWESTKNMEDLDEATSTADEELGGLDLSDIKSELDEEEEPGLSNRSLETEEEIDQAIDEELERLERIEEDL